MSIRTKVIGLFDVMMRVPPIFVIDEILKIGMGLPTWLYPNTSIDSIDNSTFVASTTIGGVPDAIAAASNQTTVEMLANSSSFTDFLGQLSNETEFYHILSITTIKFLICLFGLLSATCIFLLWTRHLLIVYPFIVSVYIMFKSYWRNVAAIALLDNRTDLLQDIVSLNFSKILDPGGIVMAILPTIVLQVLTGLLFAYIHLGPRHPLLQKIMPLIFVSPMLLGLLHVSSSLIQHTPAIAFCIPFILINITLWKSAMDIVMIVLNCYYNARDFVTNFGLSALIENEWQRLNVPTVLRIFWTLRIGKDLYGMFIENDTPLLFLTTSQNLLVSGCETLTAVLGMTSIISIVCHFIGKLFQLFLLSEDSDEEKSLGTVSAVLFYILALQTGLTSLSPEKRFVRLCRNLCLLVTALLHFLHNIVSPILMSLSAARNPSKKRHARALTVSAFLLTVPAVLLSFLWSRHSPSTWLLAVTAFSVEVVVKVLVSLATYALFLFDARRQIFWEKLDDYVYYIRAFGNSVEFCFGILLFFNGAWILIFESGGAIRAIMMCIHAYFNIWCEARAGWSVFMKRRTAVHKISSLPEATPLQLRTFDDVCAICYQEMTSAKITRCRHFFHGVCLRKWLYVQDRCPLCHEIIMYTDLKPDEKRAVVNREEQQEDRDNPDQHAYPQENIEHDSTSPSQSQSLHSAAVAGASTSSTLNFRISQENVVQE